jgi:hypothetical protein
MNEDRNKNIIVHLPREFYPLLEAVRTVLKSRHKRYWPELKQSLVALEKEMEYVDQIIEDTHVDNRTDIANDLLLKNTSFDLNSNIK